MLLRNVFRRHPLGGIDLEENVGKDVPEHLKKFPFHVDAMRVGVGFEGEASLEDTRAMSTNVHCRSKITLTITVDTKCMGTRFRTSL